MGIRRPENKNVVKNVEMLANDKLGRLREEFKNPLPKKYFDAFENIVTDTNQELMVMETMAGQVIGTLQFSFIQYLSYLGSIRAQIEALRVHKDFRSKGIGQQLFEWAIERAKNKAAHVVQLTTDKKRLEALRFYEKIGFKASHGGMKLHL